MQTWCDLPTGPENLQRWVSDGAEEACGAPTEKEDLHLLSLCVPPPGNILRELWHCGLTANFCAVLIAGSACGSPHSLSFSRDTDPHPLSQSLHVQVKMWLRPLQVTHSEPSRAGQGHQLRTAAGPFLQTRMGPTGGQVFARKKKGQLSMCSR